MREINLVGSAHVSKRYISIELEVCRTVGIMLYLEVWLVVKCDLEISGGDLFTAVDVWWLI